MKFQIFVYYILKMNNTNVTFNGGEGLLWKEYTYSQNVTATEKMILQNIVLEHSFYFSTRRCCLNPGYLSRKCSFRMKWYHFNVINI